MNPHRLLLPLFVFLGIMFLSLPVTAQNVKDVVVVNPASAPVPVTATPIAVASAQPLSGHVPLFVQFVGTAVAQPGGAPVAVSWDFGDGLRDTMLSPGHTYFDPGTFKAVLQVVDVHGFISTDSVVIKVEPEILLNFLAITSDPSNPSPGQPVGFDFVFSGGTPPFSLLWEFGDGTSSALNPTFHTYTVAGEYHVFARVVDANGQDLMGELSVTVTTPTP